MSEPSQTPYREPAPNAKLEFQASRARRNPWVTAFACIPWICTPAFYALIGPGTPGAVPMTLFVALVGCALFVMVWKERPYPRTVRATIHVTPDELCVDETRLARSQIQRVELILTTQALPIVRISRRWRVDIDLVMSDEARARELLVAIGFDPTTANPSTAGPFLEAWAGLRRRRRSYKVALGVLLGSVVTAPITGRFAGDFVLVAFAAVFVATVHRSMFRCPACAKAFNTSRTYADRCQNCGIAIGASLGSFSTAPDISSPFWVPSGVAPERPEPKLSSPPPDDTTSRWPWSFSRPRRRRRG